MWGEQHKKNEAAAKTRRGVLISIRCRSPLLLQLSVCFGYRDSCDMKIQPCRVLGNNKRIVRVIDLLRLISYQVFLSFLLLCLYIELCLPGLWLKRNRKITERLIACHRPWSALINSHPSFLLSPVSWHSFFFIFYNWRWHFSSAVSNRLCFLNSLDFFLTV